MPDWVSVSFHAIEPEKLRRRVADPAAGAVVVFLGVVRNHAPGKQGVTHLVYEAYEELVESKIQELVVETREKWPVLKVAVQHRLGEVTLQEESVAVVVSASHRAEAFHAARYLIDELKARAPIWKQEHWQGNSEWIEGS